MLGTSAPSTSEVEGQANGMANLRGDFFLPTAVPRGPVRNSPNALIRPPPTKLGIPTPPHGEIPGVNVASGDPCWRPLLLATANLRLPSNADWNYLLPRLSDARALTFRRLTRRDSACLANADEPHFRWYGRRNSVLAYPLPAQGVQEGGHPRDGASRHLTSEGLDRHIRWPFLPSA